MTDKKVEALAGAIRSSWTAPRDGNWEEETDLMRERWHNSAVAVLRHLNCVSPTGEVYVPDVQAAVERLRACSIHSTRDLKDQCVEDAIRALTGGTDGE